MKRVFVTGMTRCEADPDVQKMRRGADVESMWVDVQARGQGLPGGTFPERREFDSVIYVVSLWDLGSTQMGVHFAETESRIKANERFVLPIDEVLDSPRNVQLLKAISHYPPLDRAAALEICKRC